MDYCNAVHHPETAASPEQIVHEASKRSRVKPLLHDTLQDDTIEEFNVDSKAEYSALSSTRSQKKKLKQTTPVPL